MSITVAVPVIDSSDTPLNRNLPTDTTASRFLVEDVTGRMHEPSSVECKD